MSKKNNNQFSVVNAALVLGIAAMGMSVTAGSAHAQATAAQSSVQIQATVPSMCAFDSHFDTSVQLALLPSGKPDSSQTIETSAQVTCNAPASVELRSANDRMVRVPPPQQLSDPYVTSFDYTATLLHDTTSLLELNTENGPTATAASAFADMPTEAALTLEIVPHHVAGVLQSGLYQDEITVLIIPE